LGLIRKKSFIHGLHSGHIVISNIPSEHNA
jgi:hypothetical protein